MPKPPSRAISNEAWSRAGRLQAALREVRWGKLPSDAVVDGLRLLSRVSAVGSSVCYHLTQECRDALRDGGCLPWGA